MATRKKTTRKKTTRRTSKKRAPARKAAVKPTYKFSKAAKPRSKSDVYSQIAENTELSRKDVAKVFDCLEGMIAKDLKKTGPQAFNLPGLLKIIVKRKPAQRAIKNWRNPFTGELQTKAAKPASNQVKVRPLKALKEMV